MLVSGAVHHVDRTCHADAFLPKGQSSPMEMLERIRVMVARKRGPRKQVERPEAASASQAVSVTAAGAAVSVTAAGATGPTPLPRVRSDAPRCRKRFHKRCKVHPARVEIGTKALHAKVEAR